MGADGQSFPPCKSSRWVLSYPKLLHWSLAYNLQKSLPGCFALLLLELLGLKYIQAREKGLNLASPPFARQTQACKQTGQGLYM